MTDGLDNVYGGSLALLTDCSFPRRRFGWPKVVGLAAKLLDMWRK